MYRCNPSDRAPLNDHETSHGTALALKSLMAGCSSELEKHGIGNQLP